MCIIIIDIQQLSKIMGIKVDPQKPFVFQKATETQARKDYAHLFPKPETDTTPAKQYALYKNDRWKGRITYVEPACAETYKTQALNAVPESSLDALITAEVKRRGAKVDPDPQAKKTTPSSKKELAASAVNRPDMQLDLFLKSDMAKVFNIDARIKTRIANAIEKIFPEKLASHWLFISKIIDFFLSNIGSGKISSLLESQLQGLEPTLAKTIKKELLKIRKELREILGSKYEFSHDNKLNGKSYYDKDGNLVLLTSTVTSDVDSDSLVLGRNVFSKKGKLICTTGRPESADAAKEQAKLAYLGKLKERLQAGLLPPANGQPFHYVVNTFLNSTVLGNHGKHKEEIRLRNEAEILKLLTGQQLEVEYEGTTYTFTCQPILLPRSMNGLSIVDETIGKEPPLAQEIRKKNFPKFRDYVNARIADPGFDPGAKTLVETCMARLENGSKLKPHQELFLRDLVCKLLDIPPVYHCAHSKDRTALAVMNSSALQQWMDLSEWLGRGKLDDIPTDPLELLEDYRFKDLAFADAMLMHQTSAFALSAEGTVGGEQLDNDKIGFNNDLPGSPIAAEIFPKSELKSISLVKQAVAGFFGWVLLRPLAIITYLGAWIGRTILVGGFGVNPESMPALAWITSFNPLEAAKIIVRLDKLYLPTTAVDKDSSFIKDNHLFVSEKKSKPRIADDVKDIVKAIDKADISKLAKFLAGEKTKKLTPAERKLLVDVASNFELLKRVRDNKGFTTSNLKKLMAACEKSEITAFKLLRTYTHEFVSNLKKEFPRETVSESLHREIDIGHSLWSDEYPNLYDQVEKDYERTATDEIFIGSSDKKIDMPRNDMKTGLGNLFTALKELPPLQDLADKDPIPLPIQALFVQTAKASYDSFQNAGFILNEGTPIAQKGDWKIDIQSAGDKQISATYTTSFYLYNLQDRDAALSQKGNDKKRKSPIEEGFYSEMKFSFTLTFEKTAGEWKEIAHHIGEPRFTFFDVGCCLTNEGLSSDDVIADNHEFTLVNALNGRMNKAAEAIEKLQTIPADKVALFAQVPAKVAAYKQIIQTNLVKLKKISPAKYAQIIEKLHLDPLPDIAPVIAAPAPAKAPKPTLKGRFVEWCKDFGSGLLRIISPRSMARVLVHWDKDRAWRLTVGRVYAFVLFWINAGHMVAQAAKIVLIKPILRIASIIPPVHNYLKKKKIALGVRGFVMDGADLSVLVKRTLQNLWDVAFGLQSMEINLGARGVKKIQNDEFFSELWHSTKRLGKTLVKGSSHIKNNKGNDRLHKRVTKELLVPFRPAHLTITPNRAKIRDPL